MHTQPYYPTKVSTVDSSQVLCHPKADKLSYIHHLYATVTMSSIKEEEENESTSGETESSRGGPPSLELNAADGRQVAFAKKKSSVSFDSVRVLEHGQGLSDNPAVSSGLPVGLTWTKEKSTRLSVDDFEQSRTSEPGKKPERLSSAEREDLIMQSHSMGSIRRMSDEIKRIQMSRRAIEEEERSKEKRSHGYKAPLLVRWIRGRKEKRAKKKATKAQQKLAATS